MSETLTGHDQRTAQLLLQEHGICIDPSDGRTEVEVARDFGLLPVLAAGVEIDLTEGARLQETCTTEV
jgi:hypothetical protein